MKKTTKSKMFIGAAIFLALLLTGCSSPAGGGGENYDEPLPEINDIVFGNSDWNVLVGGLSAGIVDRDPVFSQFPQYGDALVDTHGKVFELATHTTTTTFKDSNNVRGGNSALLIKNIIVSEESALSFDYKCDLFYGYGDGVLRKNYLRVFIDDEAEPAFEAYGSGQMWQKESLILSAGTHSVKFLAETEEGWYGWYIKNAAYIDNVTLAPNTIASVDIYPKGLQETYVNGDTIQFSAKALRSDGSVIPNKDVTWTSTGGSIDSNGLFTPGNTKGTFTVTASIDGFTASNKTVKIHGSDYLTDPVTINGHTFTGNITYYQQNSAREDTNKITFLDPTPKYSSFITDGFFVLKGNARDTCAYVRVVKYDDDDSTYKEFNRDYKYQTSYIIKPGDFEQKIWLRFGDGDYDVTIFEASVTFYEDYDGYEGASLNYSYPGDSEPGSFIWFNVTNKTTFNHSADDCAYLLPSYYIQCDDFLITNAFNAVMAELQPDATLGMKLQALYDWEARRSHYDYVSFTDTSTTKRKRQDALHVLKYGMCVCEGYADLYTAFARLLGVKAAYQSSANLNHAWTELNYKGKWKMVDITWDDPSETGTVDKNPTAENYWYFLIDPNDARHAKRDSEGNTITPYQYDRVTDYSRSAN